MSHAEEVVEDAVFAFFSAGPEDSGSDVGNYRATIGNEVSDDLFFLGADGFAVGEDHHFIRRGIKFVPLDVPVGDIFELQTAGPDCSVPGLVDSFLLLFFRTRDTVVTLGVVMAVSGSISEP